MTLDWGRDGRPRGGGGGVFVWDGEWGTKCGVRRMGELVVFFWFDFFVVVVHCVNDRDRGEGRGKGGRDGRRDGRREGGMEGGRGR